MKYRNEYPGVNPVAVKAVRCSVRKLVGTAGIHHSDVEDLEQDLMLHLLTRMDKFDPSRASFQTFINRVVEAGVRDIIDSRQAKRRGLGIETALLTLTDDAEDTGEASVTWEGEAGIDGRAADSLGHALCFMDDLNLRLDVERAIKKLPQSLQEICQRLGRETQVEIATDMEQSRIGLYRLITTIRETFEEMGLGAHLGLFPDLGGHFSPAFRK